MAPRTTLPWLRILTEGAVIVVSILLALAADAWWAGVAQRRAAVGELTTVLEELRESLTQIEASAGWHTRIHASSRSLLGELEAVPGESWVVASDTSVAHLVLLATAEPPTASLDAFIAAGRLEQIRSSELRAGLLGWVSIVEDLTDDELRVRRYVDEDILPYLREEFDVGRAISLAGPIYLGSLDPDRVGETRLRSTATLRALVAYQVTVLDFLAIQARSAMSELEALTRLIELEVS